MSRLDKNPDIDLADGTEDPPLASYLVEAALERWEHLDRAESKRQRSREPTN